MAKGVEPIITALKGIIDQKSPGFLEEEPYQVYTKLVESGAADRKTAAALFHFLVIGLLEEAKCDDAELLSGIIRRECSLNKRMSDRLALILLSLYSDENRRKWKGKDREGFKQFMKEEFTCSWKGFAVWDDGNGTVDCHYEAEIILKPTESIVTDEELVRLLNKNPFMAKDMIHDLFVRRLKGFLDYKFEEYCTEDDYYQPVVGDFGVDMDYALPKWCEENGLELLSFEGNGDDGGYEPKFSRGWY